MAEVRKSYMRRTEEEEEEEEEDKLDEKEAGRRNDAVTSCRSPVKKKQVHTCWKEMLQKFVTAQELGNNLINTVPMVTQLSGGRFNCF